ncbi:unnamed protein product [Kuraishia capsulata CBS 1993]|uniref:Eukaryotic translation initiation factor 3 subunit B n=1 Tax=Kuraishia capsulata CBS 1993 TaxID=1382522 RepID=W6MJ71_9ASCO|nr:uncharacterized protein KUCA_T00002516001 [Kuraishia capsulata CBS 1993]CDK26544.1 unnamed protein product [Kuraishia capsulata CBS 1993]
MPSTVEEDINIDDIDFSDLESKYAVQESDNILANYVVVDGAPIAPEAKAEMLKKVLNKLFSTIGKVKDMHMPVADGKTKGFLFVEYFKPEFADAAVKQLNGKKLDVKHRLLVNKLSDIEKYAVEGHVTDEFQEPEIPPFKETGYLRSWLQDPTGRDQFTLQMNDVVGVYWNKARQPPEACVEPRAHWTSAFVKYSPKGSFLFSIHPQGVQAWGGPDYARMKRFAHPDVRLIDFSADGKFLVSLSPSPIVLPPEDSPARASCPFGPESEGHKLVIWDLATGLPARTFPLPPQLEKEKKMIWPLVKWSYDDKYCARIGPDALAVYETETFQLVDKKIIKIEGIMDFEWAPAGVYLANSKKNEPGEHLLTYWTPEINSNQTARVAVMQIPSKEVLRTVNLFQVSDCKLHWQDQGKFLCVKVDRHTKSKKTVFTNLEFFQLEEKGIPVEKLELKDVVVNFAWEPKGERFVVICTVDMPNVSAAVPRNVVAFYGPEIQKGKINPQKKWTEFKSFDKKRSNTILWSPKGRFVAVATVLGAQSSNSEIEFFDADYDGDKKDQDAKINVNANLKLVAQHEYAGLTDLAWDPSGRYLAAWSSAWRHKIENGYRLYDLAGHLLREDLIDNFKAFEWRPRPASLLTAADRKKVRKNLKEYSAQFDELDAMEADTALRELILLRRRLLKEWTSWRQTVVEKLAELGLDQKEETDNEEIIEEIKEEILEETEEVIE